MASWIKTDITFCANSDKCPSKATCRRSKEHTPMDHPYLSMSNFYTDGIIMCDSFLSAPTTKKPKGDKK